MRALASKVRYRIDPDNPYPRAYTGHISATLRDGRSIEERQPHLRGGAQEPLTRAELEEKFARNAAPAAGRKRASPMPWRSPARCSTAPSIWAPGADEADATDVTS